MNPMTEKETIKDGLHESFYKNGQLKFRGNFKNGKRDGLWKIFYSKSDNNPFILHGPINTRKNYKNGQRDGLVENFNKNGQLGGRTNYINGKLHGLRETFYFISNNNPLVLYGPIRIRENYNNGKRDGLYESFYKNGQLKTRKNYTIQNQSVTAE